MLRADALSSLRSALEFFKEQGDLLEIKAEADPMYVISGIQKALDDGPCILFENIKGYPNVRDVGNVFARRDRIVKMFGASDQRDLMLRCVKAMKAPIPPKEVKEAPCQEVVITEKIDVMNILPVIKHTEKDGGRLMGGGNYLLRGKFFGEGSHISFNRTSFRGKDWGTIHAVGGTHLGDIARLVHRGGKIPITANIGNPPAVTMIAGTSFVHSLVPEGTDELGFAGGLQGFPVEVVKARTVDAWAIANAEWVIEGYLDTAGGSVWETDEAEKIGTPEKAPFFPEWPGYLGKAVKATKLQVTAITHRKDRPIFFTPLAHSYEGELVGIPFREACFYEMADRLFPGLVKNTAILPAIAGWGANVIFQVKKRRPFDDGYARALVNAALSTAQHLRLVVVVDDDVDISTSDGVLWAIATRVDPATDIITGGGGLGQIQMPGSRKSQIAPFVPLLGGVGFDATIRYEHIGLNERPKHPVHLVDLKKFLPQEKIDAIRLMQSEYARIMAKTGW